MKVNVVMYHYTRDLKHSRYLRLKGLDYELFRQQIHFLKENFNIVSMEEVIAAADGKYELPEQAALLTFDDGYIDNYTYALPILEEAKVQGAFFIPGKTFATHQLLDVNKIHFILASADIGKLLEDVLERMDYYRGGEYDYPSNKDLFQKFAQKDRFDSEEVVFIKKILQTVLPEEARNRIASDLLKKHVGVTEEQLAYELYMTEDQIRTMKRHGMYIGIHGYDHYWLGNLPQEKMREDISKALEVMDEFIDGKRWVMNYPYGNYNEKVIRFIEEKGACLGLTTKVAVADLKGDNRFELPRLDCNDFPPISDHYREINIT